MVPATGHENHQPGHRAYHTTQTGLRRHLVVWWEASVGSVPVTLVPCHINTLQSRVRLLYGTAPTLYLPFVRQNFLAQYLAAAELTCQLCLISAYLLGLVQTTSYNSYLVGCDHTLLPMTSLVMLREALFSSSKPWTLKLSHDCYI